jgi:translation initiation factor IF-2
VLPVGAVIGHEGVVLKEKDSLEEEVVEDEDKVRLLIKSDVAGTLEAIIESLPAQVQLVSHGTGAITDSDILLAQTTKAAIVGFRVKPNPTAKKLAKVEKIKILTFSTIYDLLEMINELVAARLEANKEPEPTGKAKVVKLFEHNGTKIVGGKVVSGIIYVGDRITVTRGDKEIGQSRVNSIRIARESKNRVTTNQEFGVVLADELDIKPDDELYSQHENV